MTTRSLRVLTVPALLAGVFAGAFACTNVDRPGRTPVVAPPADAAAPVNLPGLHNFVTYGPGLYCGSVPFGREGLTTLAWLGVKTVISADGATPDVATAEQLGLHYVHLPFSYDGVPAERRAELAAAVASCAGPIYLHCHHGKHRSAAALAAALVGCGLLDEGAAASRMKVSGTAPSYAGLWQSVRDSRPLDANALHVDPATFPSVAEVSGLVAAMSAIDLVFDDVTFASRAGFATTAEHPDLVPKNATRRLAELFAGLQQDAESQALPAAYQQKLATETSATAEPAASILPPIR
jgi:protein tyrosine phosphatase (PTP) superfamily phosphohydrolase (DUF442 family)